MNKIASKAAIIVYLFLLIYNPPIIGMNFIYILVMVSALYIIVSMILGRKFVYEYYSVKAVLILSFLILWQVITAWFSGYGTLDAISDYIIILAGYIVCSIVLHNYLLSRHISNKEFFDLLLMASLVQVFFTVLAYLCPDFQKWFIIKMGEYGYEISRFSALSQFRWYGMAAQLGFATPVVQTILSLITLYFGFTRSCKYYIASFFLLLSAIVNARTSVILFFIGFIICVFSILRKRKAKYLLTSLAAYIWIAILLLMVFLFFMKKYSYANFVWLINGLLDFLGFNVDTNGAYEVGNYFLNLENYRLPSDYKLLIGSGVYLYKMENHFRTDIGYIIDIWKYGIPLIFLIYYMIIRSLNRIKKINIFNETYFGLMLLVVFMVSNIKGNIISATPIAALYIVMLLGFPEYKMNNKIITEMANKI
ncbi:MAG: hypothetical protein HFG70_09380 [Hungatella sp.]|nr:hypothetical protein [Hungatella sp.]